MSANPAGTVEIQTAGRHAFSRGIVLPMLLLLPIAAVIFFWNLDRYSLVNGDEAYYQGIAEAMVESGDWLAIELRGRSRPRDAFLNAPYNYWARAALIAVFGSNLWTARVLAALFATGVLVLTCWWAHRAGGVWSALAAGGLLLTTYQFVFLHGARTGELEPLVSFFLLSAAATFLHALRHGGSFVPHHLCIVALMGLKSPLAVVPLAADLAILILRKDARPYLKNWIRSGLLILPIGLIWPAIQVWRLGDNAVDGLKSMVISAGVGGDAGESDGLLLYYARWLAAGAFPWSVLVPLAVVHAFRSLRSHSRAAVLLAYPASLLLFYLSIDQHYPWYVIPCYPFLAIMVSMWIRDVAARGLSTWTIAGVALALAVAFLLRVLPADLNPVAQRAMDITLRLEPRLGGIAGLLALVAAAIALGTALRITRKQFGTRVAPLVAAAIVIAVVVPGAGRIASGLRRSHHLSPLAELRRELDRKLTSGEEIQFPIVLPRDGFQAIYYFGDEFVIRFPQTADTQASEDNWYPVLAGLRRGVVTGEKNSVKRAWLAHPGRIR